MFNNIKNRIIIQKLKHNHTLTIDASNPKFLELSIADADNPLNYLEVYLEPQEVDALINLLETWKQSHIRDYVSKNEKFSWFNKKSED
jgi:hypothetical protein